MSFEEQLSELNRMFPVWERNGAYASEYDRDTMRSICVLEGFEKAKEYMVDLWTAMTDRCMHP